MFGDGKEYISFELYHLNTKGLYEHTETRKLSVLPPIGSYIEFYKHDRKVGEVKEIKFEFRHNTNCVVKCVYDNA